MTQDIIGVDIAKDWIDIHRLSDGQSRRVSCTAGALKRFSAQARGALVVLEASGGYERPLMEALGAAGVSFARVNPGQSGSIRARRASSPAPLGGWPRPTEWMRTCWRRWAGRWSCD